MQHPGQRGWSRATSGTCAKVCGTVVKVLLFVVAILPMLSYAGLKQERDHLITNATLFDVGFGKRLFMSCEGAGRSTVILDAPTRLTSEVWRRDQAELVRAGAGWSEAPPPLNMSDPGKAAWSGGPWGPRPRRCGWWPTSTGW